MRLKYSVPYFVTFKDLILIYYCNLLYIYDYILPVIVFKNASLRRILDGVTSLNFNLKEATLKLLISYSILAKIVISNNSILGVNTNAAFYLTFIECLYMGEISYTNKQRSKLLFTITKATCLNIQFSPSKDYLTFYLKQSKTDKDKQGI